MNLVMALVLLGGSSIAVWSGLTDPEGGTLAGLRNIMTGQGNTKRESATAAAFVHTLAAYLPSNTGGNATSTAYTGADDIPAAPAAGERGAIVSAVRTWLGTPYRWGGNTRSGVDCSGLVQQVYRKTLGIELPRVSAMQATKGTRVRTPRPGDLVAFGAPVHHIGVVIGGGKMIHAPRPGRVVSVEDIAGAARAMREAHTVQYRDVIG